MIHRFLHGAGSDDDEQAIGQRRIAAGLNGHGCGIRRAVAEIHGFSLSAGLVNIWQHHVGKQPARHKAERNGRADIAATDNANFSGIHRSFLLCCFRYVRKSAGQNGMMRNKVGVEEDCCNGMLEKALTDVL